MIATVITELHPAAQVASQLGIPLIIFAICWVFVTLIKS